MSMILDKKQKIKKLGNLKKNFKNNPQPTGKASNLIVNSFYTKSPRQKSFILKNKKRNLKSNDVNLTKNININEDDTNFLLSENDPFSRSVIYSNNKKISNNFFPSIKHKKIINDISIKKNQRVKFVNNNKNKDYTKRKIGSAQSIKNSNIKTNNMYNNLNISEDFPGISKFNEKFQLIEDKIIDKNYENDIDHDEMIIGSNKKNINNNILNKIQIKNDNKSDDELYLFFNHNKNDNNNDDNDDEYLINNIFENNKADFNIMYIDNYEKMINDDMLLLEIQLLYEKILDLQNSYHEEYNNNINSINKNKKFISLIIYKYKEIHKKNFNLLKIKENINCKNKLNTFVNIQEKEQKSYINDINNKEIILWKNMLGNKFKKNINNNNFDDKNKIIELFKKIVFNNYSSLNNTFNDIENKIVLNLIKKFNYKTLSDIKNKNNRINKEYNGNYNNSIKNKKDKIRKRNNHNIINSNGNYESNGVYNNKINYTKNNKYSSYNNYINSSKKKGF